jgi:hypothetical protein
MDKIKFPKMHSSEKFKIDTGEELIITHEKPGYGKGGILSLKRASDGYSYGTFRYGSNGMADFGTLTEAKRSLKNQVTYVEKAYQKEAEKKAAQKSESAAKSTSSKGYTSGAGGSNSGY